MTPAAQGFACAPGQAGILIDSLTGAPGDYVQRMIITCREPIDADALGRAWLRVVTRHDVLRTSFDLGGAGGPRQRVHAEIGSPPFVVDWSADPPDQQRAQWESLVEAERLTGFDVTVAPLSRVVICVFSEQETRMLWSYHHALIDGRSRLTVLTELFENYAHECGGRPPRRAPAPSFGAFADWAANQSRRPEVEAFWRQAMAGATAPSSAPGWRLAATERSSPRNFQRSLDPTLSADLRSLASGLGHHVAALMQGAFALLLGQESDCDDVLFAATRAGRRSPFEGAEDLVGLVMVASPVRLRLDPAASLADCLADLRDYHRSVRDFEHASLGDIQRWSQVERPQRLAEALFSFELGSMNARLRAADPAWERRDAFLGEQTGYALTLEILDGDPFALRALHDAAVVPDAEADRVVCRYESILRAMVERPDAPLGELTGLAPERRRELAGTAVAPPPGADRSMVARFREQAAAHPQQIAIDHASGAFTYADLLARAESLAGQLERAGVRPGSLVAVAMRRTPDLIAALLAIHGRGAAYVPLDLAAPRERMAFLLDDSGANVILTEAAARDVLPEQPGLPVVAADPAHATRAELIDPELDALAYVIYTSGSTGRPKGVETLQRGVSLLAAWAEQVLEAAELDGVLGATSLGFDVSVFELLITLGLGGRVVLVDNVLKLADPVLPGTVSLVFTVPSALSEVLRRQGLPASVRTVLIGGEVVTQALSDRIFAQAGIRSVRNVYGATEDTVVSTDHRCRPGIEPTVGRPMPGRRLYVVDRHMTAVPEGVEGQVLLAGPALARGYRGRPDLTAERFLELTFDGDDAPERVYRTGDRAVWTATGELDYRGRDDDQVKIRGIRVEPGEVAETLRGLASVADAAVVVGERHGRRTLLAYVVGDADPAALGEDLARILPEALRPAAITMLPALPVTTNGKLNRRALPEPAFPDRPEAPASAVSGTAATVAELWETILERPVPAEGNADFFALGGDSLDTLQLLSAIEERFGKRIAVGTLFDATTLADQAAAIDAARPQAIAHQLATVRAGGSRTPWICVFPDHRGLVGLRNLLPALLTDQPIYSVQAVDPSVPSWRRSTAEQIATACARAVRDGFGDGPYHLGGFSLGGVIAYELAHQLAQTGAAVEQLVLIDTAAPQHFRPVGRILGKDRPLRDRSAYIRARGQAGLAWEWARDRWAMARGDHLQPLPHVHRGFGDPWDNAGANRIMRSYRPPRLELPVAVLHTQSARARTGAADLGWSRYVTDPVHTRPIDGEHLTVLETPAVFSLAEALEAVLRRTL